MRYVDLIRDSDAFYKPHLIGVIGSVGRGEKAITDQNLNDVDFVVIAEECFYDEKLKLEKILNAELQTIFTDILFLKPSTVYKKYKGNQSFPQSYYDIISDLDVMWISERGIELKDIIKNCKKRPSVDSGIALILTRFYAINDEEIKKLTDFNYQYCKNVKALIDGSNLVRKTYKNETLEERVRRIRDPKLHQFLTTSMLNELADNSADMLRKKVVSLHKEYWRVIIQSDSKLLFLLVYASFLFILKMLLQRNWGMLSKFKFYLRTTLS